MTLHRFVQLALRAIAMIALVAAALTPGVAAHAAPVSSTTAPGGSAPEATAPDTDGDAGPDPAPAPAGEADAVTVEPSASVAAVAINAAGSTPSEPLTVTVDTTSPELTWTNPADGTAVIDPVVEVSGSVADDPAGVATVTVNGADAPVDEDGVFTTEVELAEGDNVITVTATDTVGNAVTEERHVVYVPLDVAVELPSAGGASMPVIATVTDADGANVQVDTAELTAYHEGEVVTGPREMRWTDEQNYRGLLRGLPPRIGEVDVVVTLTVDGHEIDVEGGTVTRS